MFALFVGNLFIFSQRERNNSLACRYQTMVAGGGEEHKREKNIQKSLFIT
jgi:hypothetical protein